ncbi:MAG: serine--tRNA ligase, partial [Rikenellaceae bacterium]|nr:serine--tRNA ligase [Rikenellaceae bacterium]
MLTLKQIRDNREQTIARLAIKGVDAAAAIEKIIVLDDRRKATQAELDQTLAR